MLNVAVDGGAGVVGVGLVFLLSAVVHIISALVVLVDARRRVVAQRTLWFVWPSIWALVTLLTGPLVVLAYWVMHYSSWGTEPVPQQSLAAEPQAPSWRYVAGDEGKSA